MLISIKKAPTPQYSPAFYRYTRIPNIMKTEDINKINEATLVLRHFVDLSARLLPFLDELQRKPNPTLEELRDRNKIIDVYKNYTFDTCTSIALLNSNILDLIKESFEAICLSSSFLRTNGKNKSLKNFMEEYHRLTENWYLTISN